MGSESALGLALIGRAHKYIHGAGRGSLFHPTELGLGCNKNQTPRRLFFMSDGSDFGSLSVGPQAASTCSPRQAITLVACYQQLRNSFSVNSRCMCKKDRSRARDNAAVSKKWCQQLRVYASDQPKASDLERVCMMMGFGPRAPRVQT